MVALYTEAGLPFYQGHGESMYRMIKACLLHLINTFLTVLCSLSGLP